MNNQELKHLVGISPTLSSRKPSLYQGLIHVGNRRVSFSNVEASEAYKKDGIAFVVNAVPSFLVL